MVFELIKRNCFGRTGHDVHRESYEENGKCWACFDENRKNDGSSSSCSESFFVGNNRSVAYQSKYIWPRRLRAYNSDDICVSVFFFFLLYVEITYLSLVKTARPGRDYRQISKRFLPRCDWPQWRRPSQSTGTSSRAKEVCNSTSSSVRRCRVSVRISGQFFVVFFSPLVFKWETATAPRRTDVCNKTHGTSITKTRKLFWRRGVRRTGRKGTRRLVSGRARLAIYRLRSFAVIIIPRVLLCPHGDNNSKNNITR